MLAKIVRIQKARRRLRLHRKVMNAVNRKIAFQRQERFRQEMERQQREEEAQKQQSKLAVENISEPIPTQESTQTSNAEPLQDYAAEQNYLLEQPPQSHTSSSASNTSQDQIATGG